MTCGPTAKLRRVYHAGINAGFFLTLKPGFVKMGEVLPHHAFHRQIRLVVVLRGGFLIVLL